MKETRKRGIDALAHVAANPTHNPTSPGGRPITSPGALAMMQPVLDELTARAENAERENAELRALMALNPVVLPFDQLVEIPGRKRRLTLEEFDELRQNLEHNAMVHPIIVRAMPGKMTANGTQLYEVISGYRRLEILRLLNRKVAPVRVLPLDDIEAEDASFWGNLMQPSLPDYEKFLGFRRVQERHGFNQAQLARKAGVSKQLISLLFSYQDLPDEALEILNDQPSLLGSNAAAELVKASRNGRQAQVVTAVQELAARRVTQAQAISIALAQSSMSAGERRTSQRALRANTTQIRSGMEDFCRIISRGLCVRIEFNNEEHRATAEKQIEEAVREIARRFQVRSATPGSMN